MPEYVVDCKHVPYGDGKTLVLPVSISSHDGYSPKGSPRYARGCPDGLPEMWETFPELYRRTDYMRLHPITLAPRR